MTKSGSAYIAGAHEHPTRESPNKSTMQLHAEVARGALEDAGLTKADIDGYLSAGIPEYEHGYPSIIMADYLGLDVEFIDTTDHGGSSPVNHVGHAKLAIQQGKCDVALITQAGRPRSRDQATGTSINEIITYQDSFEKIYGSNILATNAMAAQRHIHEFGTTTDQLAEIRAAASSHAQYNEDALYQDSVTVKDVLDSRVVADPLHLLDCCVITDGGGSLVVVSEDIQESLSRECVEILGHGEAVNHHDAGRIELTGTAANESGARAYKEAGVGPEDIDYASIYDAFTILVLEIIEDLGFCDKGAGGPFVETGALRAPGGELPFNTDGGGLCSNHPGNRGGMTKVIEAVRQLRRETNPEVQVDAETALAHGAGGGSISTREHSVTLVLGRKG